MLGLNLLLVPSLEDRLPPVRVAPFKGTHQIPDTLLERDAFPPEERVVFLDA